MNNIKNKILLFSFIFSILGHLLCLNPLNNYLLFLNSNIIKPKLNDTIEFEFYKAFPKKSYKLDIQNKTNNKIINKKGIIKEKIKPTPKDKKNIVHYKEINNEEKIKSDSINHDLKLDKLKNDPKIKWDYCNRIRTLVENNLKFPKDLINQKLHDVVIVDIGLDRNGKLINNTPYIQRLNASRHPQINKAIIHGIKNISHLFPGIPHRYSKEYINFSLPVEFKNDN